LKEEEWEVFLHREGFYDFLLKGSFIPIQGNISRIIMRPSLNSGSTKKKRKLDDNFSCRLSRSFIDITSIKRSLNRSSTLLPNHP